MGILNKLRSDDASAKRALLIRRLVFLAIGLALSLFFFFYVLPIWRGPAQP